MMIDAIISATYYLLFVVPLIVIGVLLAEIVIELKWVDRICFLFSPIMQFSHMKSELCLSFPTALGSPTAAFAIIADLYEKKLIGRRELTLASLVTTFPGSLAHWRSSLPILIPLVGMPGVLFFAFVMLAEFTKASIALVLARILLRGGSGNYPIKKSKSEVQHPPLREALKRSLRSAKKISVKILAVTVPVTVAVYILIDAGLFDQISLYLSGVAKYLPVPAEALSIIAAQQLNYVAAYTIAGNMLAEGVLRSRDITLTLLIGDVLASVVNLRFKIPYYIGIFSPRLGTQVLLISLPMRIAILMLIIWILMMLWY
jgi:hypothetical protein